MNPIPVKVTQVNPGYDEWRLRQEKRDAFREKYGGHSLAAYHWERQAYPEFRKIKFPKARAMFYIKKLARHFKTSCPELSNINKRGGGHYRPGSWGNGWIALPPNPSLGLVCHEYAHHLDNLRNPDTKQWHGKSFKRELKRVYTFAKRYLPQENRRVDSAASCNRH